MNYCCDRLLISKAPLSPSAFKICSKYPLCLFGYGEGQGWQANNHFSFYCRHLLFQIPSPFPSLQGFQQCAIPQLRHWGIQTLVDRPSHLGWVSVQGRQENKLDLAFHHWVTRGLCGCLRTGNTSWPSLLHLPEPPTRDKLMHWHCRPGACHTEFSWWNNLVTKSLLELLWTRISCLTKAHLWTPLWWIQIHWESSRLFLL